MAGKDVVNGRIKVDQDRLYNLFDSKTTFSNNTISITFENKGSSDDAIDGCGDGKSKADDPAGDCQPD